MEDLAGVTAVLVGGVWFPVEPGTITVTEEDVTVGGEHGFRLYDPVIRFQSEGRTIVTDSVDAVMIVGED